MIAYYGTFSCHPLVPGDHDTCQYQLVYLPINQVQVIMRLRVCNWPLEVYRNTARPRSERVCRKCSAGKPEDEYRILWFLHVLLTTTFGAAVDYVLSRISSRGGTLPALLSLDASLLLYSSNATLQDNNS